MNSERGGTDGGAHDAAVDAAWRAASTEQPSPRSDASILAAARAAAPPPQDSGIARRAMPWWIRWQPLVAAAGLAGLAFLLIQRLPSDTHSKKIIEEPARSAPAAAAGPGADNEAGAPVAAEESIAEPAKAMPPMSTAASPGRLPLRRLEGQRLMSESADRPAEQGSAGDLATAATLESTAPPGRQQAAGIAADRSMGEMPGPDDWVRRIVSMHEAGDLPAAANELRAFRRAYPDADARLPADLRQWAGTVDSSEER